MGITLVTLAASFSPGCFPSFFRVKSTSGTKNGKEEPMKVNCISCGHNLDLDDAYNDFEGMFRCYVCGALLEVKTSNGKIKSVHSAEKQQEVKKAGVGVEDFI